jgi:hypothetical protein
MASPFYRKIVLYKLRGESFLMDPAEDIALSKQHGRKLEARWSTPRIVDSISSSGVSAYVRELHHAPGKTKRYHVEDLLVYTPRQPDITTAPVATAVEYARGAMGAQEAFVPGQRAFHLSV